MIYTRIEDYKNRMSEANYQLLGETDQEKEDFVTIHNNSTIEYIKGRLESNYDMDAFLSDRDANNSELIVGIIVSLTLPSILDKIQEVPDYDGWLTERLNEAKNKLELIVHDRMTIDNLNKLDDNIFFPSTDGCAPKEIDLP